MDKIHTFSKTYLILFCLSLATSCIGQSKTITKSNNTQSSQQSQVDKINDLVRTYAEYGKFNGSILVAKKGEVIYKKAFGMANMEWDIPNQTDTKFRLASVTKQFTAMLIMQLVAENKLALDVPITNYLPSYPKENGDQINIHHLLSHTSGLQNYTSFSGYRDMMRNTYTPSKLLKTFSDSTLQFKPGNRFSYSNSGYAILGAIIEKITEKSFGEVLQEKILIPLGMENTGYDNHETLLNNRATGYHKQGGIFVNSSYIDMSVAFTAGGMYSTVEDLYLWDRALYTSKLLPKKYMDLLFEKHIPSWGQHYGYGWNISSNRLGNTNDRINTIDHDCVINGFTSLVFRIPADQSSIFILNNTGSAPMYEMSRAISAILYDKTYDLPKRSVADALLKSINDSGITKGIAHYEKVKANETYYLDEREMNMISYDLLHTNRGAEAIEVLKLGIAAFPNAFNLYDSLGEIQRALGNKEEAIKNYTKSVRLNPKNENGLKMLKELGIDIDKESLYLLKTDKSWTKEIFVFPLHFAKELNYQGTEEAHFPKGWRDMESNEFWSYTFAWKVDLDTKLSKAKVASDLQNYFDGLMHVVNKDKELVLPKTIANIQQKEGDNSLTKFTGTLNIYDAFITKKKMILNVTAEKHYCEQAKKSILLFKFSPKAFGTEIWQKLEQIKLRDNACAY